VRQFEDGPPEPLSLLSWCKYILLYERLVDSVPKRLRGSLPSIEDIERELNKPQRTGKRRKATG
jgi:hypothetical protein